MIYLMTFHWPRYRFPLTLTAEGIIKNRAAAVEYQQGMGFFWNDLAQLGATVYATERIVGFPWDVFDLFGMPYFFRLTASTFMEHGIIAAARLYKEKRRDAHHLPSFVKRIMNDLIKQEHRETLRQTLEEARFDQKVEETFEQAKTFRDNMLVHANKLWFPFPEGLGRPHGEEELRFGLPELQSVRDALDSLYVALFLGLEGGGLPLEYDPPIYSRPSIQYIGPDRGSSLTRDIDDVLGNFAKNSWTWKVAEKSPESLNQLILQ